MRRTMIAALGLALAGTLAPAPAQAGHHVFTFDVAIDARTFAVKDGVNPFDSNPPDIHRGDAFIVNGKVYPGGTIPSGTGVFSPDEPGSIGDWYCRGIFLVNIEQIMNGAPIHVNTTQLFQLLQGSALMTEGLEGPVPTTRGVVAGTRHWKGAAGQVRQVMLGTNTTGLFNLRLTFDIRTRD